MKLLVTGYARHGKDTVSEMLGLPYKSSSIAACEIFLFDELSPKYGYTSIQECFEDRVSHRAEWHELIKAYNTPDKTRLAREIMKDNDIYCGMRCIDEMWACKAAGVFDLTIWVDASQRLPPEPSSSMTIAREDCDLVINNNRTLEELERWVYTLKDLLNGH